MPPASPAARPLHAALLVAVAVVCLVPPLPGWHAVPPWGALLAGLVLALSAGNPWRATTRPLTTRLLSLSVMGLGAAMDLRAVAVVGLHGFAYTLVGVVATLALGTALGRALGVRAGAATLVSVGTAICGGSAIAAAAPAIGADDEETSAALGIVFVLNASALLLFPVVGHLLGLAQGSFGLWAALAIHDTSSVVGAAASYGQEALGVATVTKLARALWIVPVTLALGLVVAKRGSGDRPAVRARRPWFILGFLVAAAVVTWIPPLQPAGRVVAHAAQRLLVVTLFLLGLGLDRAALRAVGSRPLLLGLLLWIVVGSATLGAILLGWIA